MSFLRQSGNQQVTAPQYTGIQTQASSSALPIPILWGMTLVAPNIVWAGDFLAVPFDHSYYYFTALVLGLCEGPIAQVRYAYDGQDTYSLGALAMNVIKGASPQSPWSYLKANHPQRAIAYPGTALVVSPQYDLGQTNTLGTLSFETVGTFSGTSVTRMDADPAQVVGDFLTNAQYGVGFPAASIDATTLYGLSGATYQAYCAAIGIGFSPVLVDQEAASSILARWLQITNSTAVWSGGKLKLVPYGDAPVTGALYAGGTASFVPVTTPVYDLTDDDFVADADADPVLVTRSDPYATPNVVNLEVLSRAATYTAGAADTTASPNYYAPTPVQARDQNAIELYGLRIGPTVTAHEICNVGIGQIAAQLILQRALYVRNTYAFKLSWECCLLEPMDIVTLTDAALGLSKTPVRIVEIAEDADGLLDVTAEEFPGSVGTTPGYPVDASTNEGIISRTVPPDPVNAPIVFEPP
ncbi:phage tail protein, partial [Jatrophihabitans endophyticus]|uniref:phage tail protein n=1 Tax=Jatrophihabitans endophyticus TaxID=1206085 RepID=UPI0019E17009